MSGVGIDWFREYMAWRNRAERAERALASKFNQRECGRAMHIADLEAKVESLRREVRNMQECAERHNRLLFATGLIVNCTGCIPGAPHDYENLTEEKVQIVENIAHRLRSWWENYKYRKAREGKQP